jgi:hypothetical protein
MFSMFIRVFKVSMAGVSTDAQISDLNLEHNI